MPSLNNLIESPTDKSIHTKNNNNLRTTPKRTKQSAYQGFGPKPKHVWNGESYQTATSPAHAQQIQQTRKKFNDKFIDTKNNNNNTSQCTTPKQTKQSAHQPVRQNPGYAPKNTRPHNYPQ